MSLFQKAERPRFLKMGLYGLQGCGKTLTAGIMALKLIVYLESKKFKVRRAVGFFETETGSEYLVDMFEEAKFELLVHKSKNVGDFPKLISECQHENIPVLITDSETHLYKELISGYLKSYTKRRKDGTEETRTFMAMPDWQPVKDTWARMYSHPMVHSDLNIISCARSKTLFQDILDEVQSERSGKAQFKSLSTGTAPRSETESGFEPSLLVEMSRHYKDDAELQEQLKNAKQGKVKGAHDLQCHVIKDRIPDGMTGERIIFKTEATLRQKIDATWKFFSPHIQRINFGGKVGAVMPVETDARELFEEPAKKKSETDLLLETAQNKLKMIFPSSSGAHKAGLLKTMEAVSGSTLWSDWQNAHPDDLRLWIKVLDQLVIEHDARRFPTDATELTDYIKATKDQVVALYRAHSKTKAEVQTEEEDNSMPWDEPEQQSGDLTDDDGSDQNGHTKEPEEEKEQTDLDLDGLGVFG